jgi:hypothetical protein
MRDRAYRMMSAPVVPLLVMIIFLASSCCPAHTDTASRPVVPQSDKDALISDALTQAVFGKIRVPDYGVLLRSPTFVLLIQTACNSIVDSIRVASLPESLRVCFLPMTASQIQETADANGDFPYLRITDINTAGDDATIVVKTDWAASKRSPFHYLTGSGYTLIYHRRNGRWEFERVFTVIVQ